MCIDVDWGVLVKDAGEVVCNSLRKGNGHASADANDFDGGDATKTTQDGVEALI